ncbi:MAG: peptide chain release factor N(5)-glutamine methyltransferase [Pseudobutyrivibrio sp.]|uniref:peptide chain release factor N(5)-glutamine methyltransferase n=1 Tax=Pseudobutyrivibrio sp. TaxID=2014367 RepID=UPI0025EBBF2D|nr:peptide chain release factor N(5)-glutamine methyltransferase [Pseudobutyrivibrio sp.]MBQ6463123.1 peptide chain release factor N(5)-glutamine methyltransferase [Pseudobutyrivibrio sp.]
MTYKQALEKGIKILEAERIIDARIDAWYLLSYVSQLTKAKYFLVQNDEIDELTLFKYKEALVKRAEHVPLQHITGEQEFMGINFWVNEHVLIPRQDTETLVEEALKVTHSGSHVLDLCTGSGCVIISLVVLGQGITGAGIDISDEAIAVARDNGNRLAPGRIDFIQGNLWNPVLGKYNTIVSNPPYIPTEDIKGLAEEVKDHEPLIALDGAEDGLFFYRQIVGHAAEYLASDGWLLVEIGFDQGPDVYALFVENGFKDVEVIKDLAGNNRVVKGHL